MEHPRYNSIRLSGRTEIKNKKKRKTKKREEKKQEARKKRRKNKTKQNKKSVDNTRNANLLRHVVGSPKRYGISGKWFRDGLDLRDKRFVALQSRRWPPLTRAGSVISRLIKSVMRPRRRNASRSVWQSKTRLTLAAICALGKAIERFLSGHPIRLIVNSRHRWSRC